MLLWFYRLAFLPLLVVLGPGILWRMRRRGGYARDFGQRFGAVPSLPPRRAGVRRIWLQAVSVGEVLVVEPLIDALARRDDVELFLTTTTTTGLAVARARYAGRVLGPAYFPLDWMPFVARAWRRVQPDLVILTEGERWPELIARAAGDAVPVLTVNARISDRSFRRMRPVAGLVKGLLKGVTGVLAVSAEDAARFRALGFADERVRVTGNLKLDVDLPELSAAERAALRRELGLPAGELVLLGSSTWPGEEAALVAAWERARAAGHRCRLLVVPRHEERRDEIEALLRGTPHRFHFRSRGAGPAEVDIAVADTTGELRRMTQLADLVFVGRSLPPHHEGQTPVEAAALGRPLLFGSRMSNFRGIAHDLVTLGAAERVESPQALEQAVVRLLADAPARQRMGAAGRAWHQASRGACARTLVQIERHLTGR